METKEKENMEVSTLRERMNVQSVAKYLGFTESYVRVLVHRGKLTAHKISGGRKFFFYKDEIDKDIELADNNAYKF